MPNSLTAEPLLFGLTLYILQAPEDALEPSAVRVPTHARKFRRHRGLASLRGPATAALQ